MSITVQLRLHYLRAKSLFHATEVDQCLAQSPQTHQFDERTATKGK